MSCPELEALERWAGGDPEADPAIGEHVANCPACRDRLDDVSANLALERRARVLRDADRPGGGAFVAPAPERIGPFRVLRELGRGGMGIVYLAEQDRPRRRVALKVLRSPDASPELLRRFEREADLLARLRHPFIARVFESGVAGGLPYLAMEYVDGIPLEEWAEGALLDAKLHLLVEVAEAVHHAHGQGVLHRDVKPGNILVERSADGAAHPRVLDFGVARALGDDVRTVTMRTEPGRLLGTVPFMSPEQVEGDPAGLDARSDVYSLGVLAYWLLAGELPYALRDRSVAEMARIIRDDDPNPLATRDTRYRGDLDTIVGKALEKDAERRYASAAAFAEDIARHLADRPIVARAPSAAYQLRKFARRNRVLVGSAAALFVVLSVAAAAGSWLAVRATRAERTAREQLARAEAEAEQQEAVTGFLETMLAAPNPYTHGDRGTTVEEVLDAAAEQLDGDRFAGRPDLEAAVRRTLGRTLWALARYDEAAVQLQRVAALLDSIPGEERAAVEALGDLGLLAAERNRFAVAEATFRRQHGRALAAFGADDPATVKSLSNLAGSLADQRRLAEAESVLVAALPASARLTGPEREVHVGNLLTLGGLRLFRGDAGEAERTFREAITLSTGVHGAAHPTTVSGLVALAEALRQQDRTAERIEVCRRALALQRESFAGDHPQVATALTSLGTALVAADSLDEAEPLLREALAMSRATAGDHHGDTGRSLNDLAQLLRRRGRLDEAQPLYEEALAIYREVAGDDSPQVHTVLHNIGRLRLVQGREAEAESLLARVLAWRRNALGADHPATRSTREELAGLHAARGDTAAATAPDP